MINGLTINGLTINRLTINGLTINGLTINGLTINGLTINGLTINGLTINGLTINGLTINRLTINLLTINELVPTYATARTLEFYAENHRWSPRGRPWPRRRILKSLALASKVKSLASNSQVSENCALLCSSTALFFEQLKFH